MKALFHWLTGDFIAFFKLWFVESFKEAAKWGTSLWGLACIIALLLWTVITHAVGMLTGLLATLNSIVVGEWSLVPPASIMTFLAICNTFLPLDTFFQNTSAYLTLLVSLSLYRFVKNLIWGMPGS